MTIKKAVVATSFFLALGASLPGFAETKAEVVDGETVTIECISAAEVEAMTDEDKAKLTLPVCENVEKNEDGTVKTQ